MFHRRILALGIVTVALAGCGGGSSSITPPGPPAATATPTPIDRPVIPGASLTYTGTLTETATNNYIGDAPVTTTMNAAVSDVITQSGTATAPVYTALETDSGTLRDNSSQTVTNVTVTGTAPQVFRATSTSYADTTGGVPGTGTLSTTTYGAGNGELTVLPETSGTAFSNNAQQSYVEIDPGQTSTLVAPAACTASSGFTIDREVDALGNYTQCTNGSNGNGNGDPVYDIASGTAAFTGTFRLNSTDGGRLYTFSAPAGTTIPYTYTNYYDTPPVVSNFTAANWIPATATAPVTETDAITANVAVPAACGTAFTGTDETLQTITTIDPVYGTLETRTTATYDLPNTGTVCIAVNDTIGEYYDYTYTTEDTRLFTAPTNPTAGAPVVPVQQISMNETVGLTAFAEGASKVRATASAVKSAFIPRTLVTEGVTRFLHAEAKRRLAKLQLGGLTK